MNINSLHISAVFIHIYQRIWRFLQLQTAGGRTRSSTTLAQSKDNEATLATLATLATRIVITKHLFASHLGCG